MKPEMKMTKTAGPSAESANEKSRPQLSQRGASFRNPRNSRPLPQRGHRPNSPATMGRAAKSEELATTHPSSSQTLPGDGVLTRKSQALGRTIIAKRGTAPPLPSFGPRDHPTTLET